MKKLSLILFVAGTMLVACDNNNRNQDTAQPGDPDYVSVQGEGVDSNQDLERSNTAYDRNDDTFYKNEEQRVANWTIEDNQFEASSAAVQRVMNQMEQNLNNIEQDLEQARNGAFTQANNRQMNQDATTQSTNTQSTTNNQTTTNDQSGTVSNVAPLSEEAREKIDEAQKKVDEARQLLQEARQNQQSNNNEEATGKLKEANEKIAEARDNYLEAIEEEANNSNS